MISTPSSPQRVERHPHPAHQSAAGRTRGETCPAWSRTPTPGTNEGKPGQERCKLNSSPGTMRSLLRQEMQRAAWYELQKNPPTSQLPLSSLWQLHTHRRTVITKQTPHITVSPGGSEGRKGKKQKRTCQKHATSLDGISFGLREQQLPPHPATHWAQVFPLGEFTPLDEAPPQFVLSWTPTITKPPQELT